MIKFINSGSLTNNLDHDSQLGFNITLDKKMKIIKCKFCLASSILILSFNGSVFPSLSQTIAECEQHQEVFTFELPNYTMQHQGGAILNIKVAYRLTPDAIAKNTYPNFMPIKKDIDTFLVNYPDEGNFWEIVNKQLVQLIFDKYPQMSSLKIEMGVLPTPQWPFPRASIVSSTRPQGCPLILP